MLINRLLVEMCKGCVRIRGFEMLVFRKILHTYLMDGPQSEFRFNVRAWRYEEGVYAVSVAFKENLSESALITIVKDHITRLLQIFSNKNKLLLVDSLQGAQT